MPKISKRAAAHLNAKIYRIIVMQAEKDPGLVFAMDELHEELGRIVYGTPTKRR